MATRCRLGLGAAAAIVVLVTSLLRTIIRGPGGRELTVRYASYGAVVGLPAVIIGGALPQGELSVEQWLQVGGASIIGEALRTSRVLRLSPSRFRHLASSRPDVAWPLARYLAQQTVAIEQLLAAGIFLPVRARVARHVLDLAELEGRVLMVHASHQEIANATGTVREVVSRVLKGMARDGLVERREDASGPAVRTRSRWRMSDTVSRATCEGNGRSDHEDRVNGVDERDARRVG